MKFVRLAALAACSVALVTACGGDSDDDAADSTTTSEAAEETSTTEEATTTTEATSSTTSTTEGSTTTEDDSPPATSETGFPETPVAAFLSQAYLFGSEQGAATEDQLPFPVNTVSAHWYQSEGFYVVTYGGLDPALVLCPGNSIQTQTGFANVSNAPLNDADCSFAPVVAEPPSGVVTCNRLVSYVTLIPSDAEGVLFGTIEMMSDGLGVGLTSQAMADPANTPEIARDVIDC